MIKEKWKTYFVILIIVLSCFTLEFYGEILGESIYIVIVEIEKIIVAGYVLIINFFRNNIKIGYYVMLVIAAFVIPFMIFDLIESTVTFLNSLFKIKRNIIEHLKLVFLAVLKFIWKLFKYLMGQLALWIAIVYANGLSSTGTRISELKGAAKTNAIIAFIGGGSKASGGGGMSLGYKVILMATIYYLIISYLYKKIKNSKDKIAGNKHVKNHETNLVAND